MNKSYYCLSMIKKFKSMKKFEILLLLLIIFRFGANAQNAERPNVIFILADDLLSELQGTISSRCLPHSVRSKFEGCRVMDIDMK